MTLSTAFVALTTLLVLALALLAFFTLSWAVVEASRAISARRNRDRLLRDLKWVIVTALRDDFEDHRVRDMPIPEHVVRVVGGGPLVRLAVSAESYRQQFVADARGIDRELPYVLRNRDLPRDLLVPALVRIQSELADLPTFVLSESPRELSGALDAAAAMTRVAALLRQPTER